MQIAFLLPPSQNPDGVKAVEQAIRAAGGYDVFNHCFMALEFKIHGRPIWLDDSKSMPKQILRCSVQGRELPIDARWRGRLSYNAKQILRICNNKLLAAGNR